MRDGVDATAVERASDSDEFSNRRLIRPSLPRVEHARVDGNERRDRSERNDRMDRIDRNDRASGPQRKIAPPEQTNAENFYYQKQMQSRTPMVIVLRDGEEVHGIIEWYDRNCIKVNRENGEPNLMIYKPAIKYMFKEGENQG